jgi:alcohol dehydrogenase (cytochrome c)/quinohemoprotein ethanol dehydrogenase
VQTVTAALRAVASVDAARLTAPRPGDWTSYGRGYDEQRFSPLEQIDAQNVAQLGLAWHFDLDTARGQESTPLVIDGVMYVTSAWSKVFALDARSGERLWSYDPEVPGETAHDACCDVVNRGLAAWQGKLYLGALDGRLIALDASNGKPIWQAQTVPAGSRYTITGAPRVVKGKVLIGNEGTAMGVRGYLSAYDAGTGQQIWRFYTVPGDPSRPFESPALEKAAKTWTGEWWKHGGGGTVCDSMSYDPELDLLYIGVGTGSPWNQKLRSPQGGDNLFLSSIVALRPDTGEYVWHHQTTPGDSWDYAATQQLVLADLEIAKRERRVLLQASKNGFFYVLDRETGELISAQPITQINWATGVDAKTGRPIENPAARYGDTGKAWLGLPGPLGAHNWQPMSFHPQTGLVYVPVNDAGFPYVPDPAPRHSDLAWNIGIDLDAAGLPADAAAKQQVEDGTRGHLAAWDPALQREVWRVQFAEPWLGGVLSTAGNLILQGTAQAELVAYRADTGERLWAAPTQAGVLAAPISYEVGGEQFVAVEVGWGGAFGLAGGELARDKHARVNVARVLAFKLNGSDVLPAPPPFPALPEQARAAALPVSKASAADVTKGKALYHRYCGTCHGDSAVSGGILPDLRGSAALGDARRWAQFVEDGLRRRQGMVSFRDELSPADAELVRAYVVRRAHDAVALDSSQGAGQK